MVDKWSQATADRLNLEIIQQNQELAKMNGVMWKGVSVALMVLFYWGFDLLFHGRTWGIVDVSMAIAAVWIAPLIWRWQEKRDKLASIRDERAIRTELLLREILKKQEENS